MHHKDRAMVFFQAGRVLCHILKAKIQTQRSTDEKVFKEFKLNCSSNAKHKDIFCQGLKNALSPLASGDLVALTGTNTSRSHHTFLHFLYSTFKITTKIARSLKHSTPNWHINWGLLPFFSFITWNTSTDLQSLALSEVLFYNHSRKAEDTLQHPPHPTPPSLFFLSLFPSVAIAGRNFIQHWGWTIQLITLLEIHTSGIKASFSLTAVWNTRIVSSCWTRAPQYKF